MSRAGDELNTNADRLWERERERESAAAAYHLKNSEPCGGLTELSSSQVAA
jgi:hypothetical protein